MSRKAEKGQLLLQEPKNMLLLEQFEKQCDFNYTFLFLIMNSDTIKCDMQWN